MSDPQRIGEGPQWELPLEVDPTPSATPPPPAPPPLTSSRRRVAEKPRPVPVAKPAVMIPRVRTRPEFARRLPIWTPSTTRGWIGSIVFHVVLLLVLGLWYFQARSDSALVIETSLAGSPFGSELGDSWEGGLGMDEPLALAPDAPPGVENSTLTILPPIGELALDASVAPRTGGAAESQGGGVNLSGTGQAGSGDGFGVARFGTGTERVKGVEVKVGDPQFTLIWEGQGDLDLHVQEPGGSHIYWPPEFQHGEQGGELDVDNREGPGPENIYWVQGKGPDGVYKWFVEYYGPPPLERYRGPLRWRVRIKHKGNLTEQRGVLQQIGDRSRTYTLVVGEGR